MFIVKIFFVGSISIVFFARWAIGRDMVFPNFPEGNISTGFVDSELIQPYDIFADHPCDRVCSSNRSLICYYKMKLEVYESYNEKSCRPECVNATYLSDCPGCIHTDGVKTRLFSINRQMPGPPIHVCLNDLLIVDVINNLPEPTSMHWHGIDQSSTPYMDGMPLITQAEIRPGKIFRYKFTASNHGTNFYHSHTLWQRGQGIYGMLIVRLPPRVNPHWLEYDADLTGNSMIISDWGYNLTRNFSNFLIHGKGVSNYTSSRGTYSGAPNIYSVIPNYRYRFRLIYNGVNNLPVEFFIEKHVLIVIAADGTEIQPVSASSIVLNSGERFDFVLEANQTIDNYWIKIAYSFNRTLFQVAVLRYEGAKLKIPKTDPGAIQKPAGLQINALNVGPNNTGTIAVSELQALSSVKWPSAVRWKTTYLEIGVNRTTFNFEIDKISMTMPQMPLLVEKDRFNDTKFCNRTTLTREGINCSASTCKCTHVIQFELDSYVEIILFGTTLHPAHLHGYLFYVVGMGVTLASITRKMIIEMDHRGDLPRNNNFPILKDTVQVPSNGWVIIRFHAFNPGYWFLHCHIEFHANIGMSAVLQVGQPSQMVPQSEGYHPYPK